MTRKSFFVLLALSTAIVLTTAGGYLGHLIVMALDIQHWAQNAVLGDPMLWWVLLAYALLIAIPFVPGAEIGLMLIVLMGPPIVGPVYLTTVIALTLSFTVGRWVPRSVLRSLMARLDPIGPTRPTLAIASQSRSSQVWARCLRHRYAALIILINTPGNALLGGGGGISLVAGASGLFTYRDFIASVLIAVAPIPLLVWTTNWIV